MRLALFQPDIPQNTGTLLRLGACLGVELDIIEPCGFVFSDNNLKRAGMDYLHLVKYKRHDSWSDFLDFRKNNPERYGRIILLTTKSDDKYIDFNFEENDILLLGRESAGVPSEVHNMADARITIPMKGDARSINVAISGAMVLSEALRQINWF